MNTLMAQDASFSQPLNNPLYLNPSFTGDNAGMRFISNNRLQWFPNLSSPYRTNSISLDDGTACNFFRNFKYGLMILDDDEGDGRLRTTFGGLLIGIPVRISKKMEVSLGYGAYIVQKSIDWDKLVFSDQLNPDNNNVTNSYQRGPSVSTLYTDMSWGINSKFETSRGRRSRNPSLYHNLGFSMLHFLNPDESLYGSGSYLPTTFNFSYAITIPNGKDWKEKGNYTLIYGVYHLQGTTFGNNNYLKNSKILSYGAQKEINIGFQKLIDGAFLLGSTYYNGFYPLINQNTQTIAPIFGYQFSTSNNNRIQLSYSLNLPFGNNAFYNGKLTAATHEISIIIFTRNKSILCDACNALDKSGTNFRTSTPGRGVSPCLMPKNAYVPAF